MVEWQQGAHVDRQRSFFGGCGPQRCGKPAVAIRSARSSSRHLLSVGIPGGSSGDCRSRSISRPKEPLASDRATLQIIDHPHAPLLGGVDLVKRVEVEGRDAVCGIGHDRAEIEDQLVRAVAARSGHLSDQFEIRFEEAGRLADADLEGDPKELCPVADTGNPDLNGQIDAFGSDPAEPRPDGGGVEAHLGDQV